MRIPAAPETIRRKASARYGYKRGSLFFAGLLKARLRLSFCMILRIARKIRRIVTNNPHTQARRILDAGTKERASPANALFINRNKLD